MGKLKDQLSQITRFLGREQYRTVDSIRTCWLPDRAFGLSWRGPHNSPVGNAVENLLVYLLSSKILFNLLDMCVLIAS